MKRIVLTIIAALVAIGAGTRTRAAGILTPKGSPHAPIQMRDHQVDVVINNGFARTEVQQTFFNPNATNLEAIFSLPLPKSASLSEVTIFAGEKEIHGEVLAKDEARKVYEDEKSKGNDTGKAEKNGIQSFEFTVSPVRPNAETRIRFVYYQPLEIDTGIGRFVYPLEDGGTDDLAKSFWDRNEKVEGNISVKVELKSAWPVADVRVPGFEAAAQTQKLADGHYKVQLDRQGESLNRDFVFYYRLQDNLPGRVEVIPYRASRDKPGTFMMVVTPGLDLKPITQGADYTFVLDVSGSMQGKLHTLGKGVTKALQAFKPEDRFRIVVFSDRANELTSGFQNATPENVQSAIKAVEGLRVRGGTDLYSGIHLGLKDLDADRATSIILVTDGVANQGIIAPQEFHKLLKQHDVRVFGFLMGNSANWPLMRTICDATGGFYAGVSNDDDIIGQIMLAKSKITHECLHDASLKVSGVKILDETDDFIGKVYRGQQLVIFGRYDNAGSAKVTLNAKLTGADKTYSTTFHFPEIDTDNPEVERLFALNRIEMIEDQENSGLLPKTESEDAIRSLGLKYQLVTDHTSMVLLSDESFTQRGIERHNKARITEERRAQALRSTQPVKSYRVDESAPMFQHNAPTLAPASGGGRSGGGGGGALDPVTVLLVVVGGLAAARKTSSRNWK
jgi:Ca-activated chloride channel family protein